jgi:hypothetical protein
VTKKTQAKEKPEPADAAERQLRTAERPNYDPAIENASALEEAVAWSSSGKYGRASHRPRNKIDFGLDCLKF